MASPHTYKNYTFNEIRFLFKEKESMVYLRINQVFRATHTSGNERKYFAKLLNRVLINRFNCNGREYRKHVYGALIKTDFTFSKSVFIQLRADKSQRKNTTEQFDCITQT
jgi:hypothetical protein